MDLTSKLTLTPSMVLLLLPISSAISLLFFPSVKSFKTSISFDVNLFLTS